MEEFLKINDLIKKMRNEFLTIKQKLKNDVNYSEIHLETINSIENTEENINDIVLQIRDIEYDIDNLFETLDAQSDNDNFDDENGTEDIDYPYNDD